MKRSEGCLLALLVLVILAGVVTLSGQSLNSDMPPPDHTWYYLGLLAANVAFQLVLGFVSYALRALGMVRLNGAGVLTAAFCLSAFVAGLHQFCRWIYRHRQANQAELTGPWRFRWTLNIAGLVIVMFAAGIAMVGMAHQSVWLAFSSQPVTDWHYEGSERENASRLSTTAYAFDRNASLPWYRSHWADSREQHGWQVHLLHDLHRRFPGELDLNKPWNDPVQADGFRLPVPEFINPAIRSPEQPEGFAPSHIAANQFVIGSQGELHVEQVTDGISHTFLLGQIESNVPPWGKPGNWRDPGLGINAAPNGFGAPGPGAWMATCDGSARFFSNKTDPRVLRAMATPTAGDQVIEADLPRPSR